MESNSATEADYVNARAFLMEFYPDGLPWALQRPIVIAWVEERYGDALALIREATADRIKQTFEGENRR